MDENDTDFEVLRESTTALSETLEERLMAVAIGSDPDNPFRQNVTATAKGKLAEELLDIAFAHGIKVRQDKDLARLLTALEADSPIPTEALLAVAEIMSHIYRANREPNPFDAILKADAPQTLLEKLSTIEDKE